MRLQLWVNCLITPLVKSVLVWTLKVSRTVIPLSEVVNAAPL
jgi:hypothetical protein